MPDRFARGQLRQRIQFSLAVIAFWAWVATASRAETPDPGSSTCHEPAIGVEVNAQIAPVTVSTELTFAQISTLARQTSLPLRHPPYGFYLGQVWYRFLLHEVSNEVKGCASTLQVTADIGLIGRRVDIASDLARDTCLSRIALDHYERHANADAQAFKTFTRTMRDRVILALETIPPTIRAELDDRVRAALEVVLTELDKTRLDARATIDSPSELDKLAHPTCSAI